MKRLLSTIFLLVFVFSLPLTAGNKKDNKMVSRYNSITKTFASFPAVSIHDIQFVPLDSLKKLDTLQNTDNTRWTLQASSYMGDTVVVTGIVVTPGAQDAPNPGLSFTQHGWTLLLHQTNAGNAWGGALVRIGLAADTAQAASDGFKNIEKGDIVTITCRVEEFPTANGERVNSTTQLNPIPGYSFDIVGSATIPAPTVLSVSDFFEGPYPGGKVIYSKGEQYEASLVELRALTINSFVSTARGTWAMTDILGNYIADYDASHWFTLGNENPIIPGDPGFTLPPVGAVIDTLKGTILTVAGGENPRGYRICPIFPGDVVYGISHPSITTHRRFPVIPSSTDSVTIQAHVQKIAGGFDIGSVHLYYSLNGGGWIDHPMTMISPDSTYQAYIIDIDGNPYPANTAIRYFVKAFDIGTTSEILANSSFTTGHDTSTGFFFFTVLDRPLKISDVQYTPYSNGRSGYLGGTVTVSGIVTADSSDIVQTPTGTFGTTSWYVQDGTAPWSGIWVTKVDTVTGNALSAMRRGDSVTITGSVQEQFDVTRIADSLVTIHASNRPLPAPVNLTTDSLNESYESMLVRLSNATLTDTGVTFGDTYEFAIDDGTGPAIVRRDGFTTYSNIDSDTLFGYKILHNTDKVAEAIGVAYFSHSRWKIIPRKDPDLTVGEPYVYRSGWNMVSLGRQQLPASTGYAKALLFPGAISNAFYYSGAYLTATTIEHRKGYWVKFPSSTTIRQLGRRKTSDTVFVVTGWNLIGGLGNPVPTNSISIFPGTNHFSSFYEYTGAYAIQDSLLPSKGLWVKASEAGYFLESAPSMMIPKNSDQAARIKNKFNTLTVSDNAGNSQILYFGEDAEGKIALTDFELPPAGPEADGIDVRFASGRIVETYPASLKSGIEFAINVNAMNGPVTATWNIVSSDGKRFTLREGTDGKANAVAGQGSMTVGKSGTLSLSVANGNAIPKEYALGQNYPNPFNPSTKFEVALPATSHLEVVIYNILGQKVATVVNAALEEGFHTLVWDGNSQGGSPASTGIYFMRMTATPVSGGNAFTAVKKIVMMK